MDVLLVIFTIFPVVLTIYLESPLRDLLNEARSNSSQRAQLKPYPAEQRASGISAGTFGARRTSKDSDSDLCSDAQPSFVRTIQRSLRLSAMSEGRTFIAEHLTGHVLPGHKHLIRIVAHVHIFQSALQVRSVPSASAAGLDSN